MFDERSCKLTLWLRANGPDRLFDTCGGYGVAVKGIQDVRERRVRDLSWGTWTMVLVLEIHRVRCKRCGVKAERFEFVEGKHPLRAGSRRLLAGPARTPL